MTTERALRTEQLRTIWLEWMLASETLSEQEVRRQVDFIERAMAMPPGSRILDLTCGNTLHLQGLVKRGYRLTGADIAAEAVELARRELQDEGVEAELLTCDLRSMPFKGLFDGAIHMWSSFGTFNAAEDLQILVSVQKALKPGGRFILDVMPRDRLVREFQRYFWFEDARKDKVILERDFDPLSGRVTTRWILLKQDGSTIHDRRNEQRQGL
ncbi:MAG: methyltransferase domain-containing protein [Chloroflexi bacterium]|nr:methyltransferase domain-containing protein [Chloroflexota bacterium]